MEQKYSPERENIENLEKKLEQASAKVNHLLNTRRLKDSDWTMEKFNEAMAQERAAKQELKDSVLGVRIEADAENNLRDEEKLLLKDTESHAKLQAEFDDVIKESDEQLDERLKDI